MAAASSVQRVMLLKPVMMAVLSACIPSAAFGSVIYSNLNPDQTKLFNDASLFVATDSNPSNEKMAMPFRAGGSSAWLVTEIDVAIREDLGGSFSAVLSLAPDSGGVPGPAIGTWTLTHLPANSHLVGVNCCALTSLDLSASPVKITGGAVYWLIAQPVGRTVADVWYANTVGATGTTLKADGNGTWRSTGTGTIGAFDVLGAAATAEAPEPSTAFMFISSLTLIGVWKTRRTT